MTEEYRYKCEERSPALADGLKILWNIAKDNEDDKSAQLDYQRFLNFANLDYTVELLTTYKKSDNYGKSHLLESLTGLEEIASRVPQIRQSLRGYLPRLYELSKKDPELKGVYGLYEKIFGGKTQ